MTKYNKVPVIIAIVALFGAFGDMPYGYYQFLRFVVCGVGAYAAYMAYTLNKVSWAWAMGIIAFIFNPFIKFYFDRSFWQLLDLIAAVTFIVSLFTLKSKQQDKV